MDQNQLNNPDDSGLGLIEDWDISDENLNTFKRRIAAQFEMATGTALGSALDHVQRGPECGYHLALALVALNREHGLAMSFGPDIIRSELEQGYWCNDFGWVSDPIAATGYRWKHPLAGFAPDARYVSFANAKPFPVDMPQEN